MKTAVVFFCVLVLMGAAVESRSNRKLLAKAYKLNWRKPHPLEMTVNYGDTLKVFWSDGDTKTGIVQMDYPGVCTNGVPAKKTKFNGVTVKGDAGSQKYLGYVQITFNTAGSFFFTSPVKGECDGKWLHVTVNTPPALIG